MKWPLIVVRIAGTMRRLLLPLALLLGLTFGAAAQDAAGVLLPRINNLRASKGLPAYALNAALTAAADNHARWMANTGEIAHYQHDGSGPRTRAVKAGFPSDWISENIYRGASALTAWEWWLNSPTHYAGIVSPNYDKIGIGSASGAHGNTYVLVFGNSTGRLLAANPQTGSQAGGSAAAGGQPSYVLGLDEFGNIKHEVQPGQTIGDIALIYGYTWDDIPHMLEINGLTWDDIRLLQPGAVFLVPPQAGTFTPAPATPAQAATATLSTTATATARPSATPISPMSTAELPRATTASIRIKALPTVSEETGRRAERSLEHNLSFLALLGIAIVVQIGIIGAAAIALLRRYH